MRMERCSCSIFCIDNDSISDGTRNLLHLSKAGNRLSSKNIAKTLKEFWRGNRNLGVVANNFVCKVRVFYVF